MKYLSDAPTFQDKQKKYKQLLKKMHPDVGGVPEDCRALISEFEIAKRDYESAKNATISPETKMCAKVQEYLSSVRLSESVEVACYKKHVDIALGSGVASGCVLEVERSLWNLASAYGFSLTLQYTGVRHRPYKIVTCGDVTYIDFTFADHEEAKRQRRWAANTEEQLWRTCTALGKYRYEFFWDSVAKHGYIMHCSRTLRLNDFVGRGIELHV